MSKNLREEALQMHRENQGKLEVRSKVQVKNAWDLSLAYSPGVAEPCLEIHADESKVNEYCARGNMVAVVSTGTAVLGLGDIGPYAALPVMEGKCVLFKNFGGVDAFPLCIATTDVDEVVHFVKLLEPTFAGINLEDIAAPECFEIEERLKKETGMAIFHDDQHGTAIVTLAALINALKLTDRNLAELKIVVNGAGASAMSVTKLIISAGANPEKIIMCDSKGAIFNGRTNGMNRFKQQIAEMTNAGNYQGDLAGAMVDADVFIGLSVAGAVTKEMVQSMHQDPILFPMANPTPEIMPEEAKLVGVRIIGTGRSDYPNQINNVLAFPGVFRGTLDVEARDINEAMKVAAAHAIANLIPEAELAADYIIPSPFDERVAPAVAAAVGKAAIDSGVARKNLSTDAIIKHTKQLLANI